MGKKRNERIVNSEVIGAVCLRFERCDKDIRQRICQQRRYMHIKIENKERSSL